MIAGRISISVILPNYNHAEELKTSLPAVLAQHLPPDEIIIIDDASVDHSISVIREFMAASPAIRLVRHERRLGVAAAVNRGLAEAQSDFVILTSADEKIAPEMTAELAGAISRFPQAELAVSFYSEWFPETGIVKVHDRCSKSGMWYAESDEPFFVTAEQLQALARKENVFLHVNTAVFNRKALLDVGGFDPLLQWHSDWFAIYAIAFRSGFGAVPRSLSFFRMEEDSYSRKGIRDSSRQEEVMLNIIDKLNRAKFAYFRHALLRAPAVMSPFLRAMLLALMKRPLRYPEWFWVWRWWLSEVVKGRRPGAWAACAGRLRGLFMRSPA
jgi:glycosyltransferase involved in cell wall biosynthesis